MLNQIHGAPTFLTLMDLKKKLQANARSIGSDLGGGAHGLLGVVLSPPEYALLSKIPYKAFRQILVILSFQEMQIPLKLSAAKNLTKKKSESSVMR